MSRPKGTTGPRKLPPLSDGMTIALASWASRCHPTSDKFGEAVFRSTINPNLARLVYECRMLRVWANEWSPPPETEGDPTVTPHPADPGPDVVYARTDPREWARDTEAEFERLAKLAMVRGDSAFFAQVSDALTVLEQQAGALNDYPVRAMVWLEWERKSGTPGEIAKSLNEQTNRYWTASKVRDEMKALGIGGK